MEIISRKEALARELKRYYTGEVCKNGHTVERYVNGLGCVECHKVRDGYYERQKQQKELIKKYGDRIISRKEAKVKVLTRYYTGKPCKHGHLCERTTVNGACVACTNNRQKENRLNNLEKHREYDRNKYVKRPKGPKAIAKEQKLKFYVTGKSCKHGHTSKRRTNDGECIECAKQKRENLTDAQIKQAAKTRKQWKANNRGLCNANWEKRRATKLQATPNWSEDDQILEIYEGAEYLSRLTGIKWDVDHIIPLTGRKYVWEDETETPEVSGLHVYSNLQYLPHKENMKKSNQLLQEYSNREVK